MMFTGTFTALITPFNRDGSIDGGALARLVEQQIEQGVDGLVPVGTTGESPTVSHEENVRVVELVVRASAGRVPVIAGTGSNSTAEAIDMTRRARDLGADATLQVTPYYNKPNQEGLYQHFVAVAEQGGLPVVVYDIPGRTSRAVEIDTIVRLAAHPQIVGLKAASGSVAGIMNTIAAVPEGFSILSGDDNLAFSVVMLGGHGVVSVASNIVPQRVSRMIRAAIDGRVEDARREHYALLPLFKAVFVDTNPIPIKYMASRLGICADVYRLPLIPVGQADRTVIDEALKTVGLL